MQAAQTGTLYGIGVGPGDPELISLKAARLLKATPVIAVFAKRGNPGNAWRIIESHLSPEATVIRMDYPVTTEIAETDPAYRDALVRFYEESVAALRAHLDVGRDVAVPCVGDPFFYGSYAHLHERLFESYPCEVVPGITAMSGCWTRTGQPIICGDGSLSVLSGTMDGEKLAERLKSCEAAVIMKVGRNLPKIRTALSQAGILDRAIYVERGTTPEERIVSLADQPDEVGTYFGIVLVPGTRRPL